MRQRCLFLLTSLVAVALGAREFQNFATSDLLRHARAKQLTDDQPTVETLPQAQRRMMRPTAPVIPPPDSIRGEPSNQILRSTQYDQNGNRVKKAVAQRAVKPNSNSRLNPPRIQPRPVQPYQGQRPKQQPFGPSRPARSNERPPPSYNQRPAYQYPRPEAVAQEKSAPIPREPFSEYAEEPYVARSGPAVAPSNINEAYVESPYGYEAPPEQRNIQEAVYRGADAYNSRDAGGVYQNEDRLSFHIQGHDGPHSYRYGFDTGHGYNRQFRYEERDGKGYLKGRYGFFDEHGKLRVTNYSADPHAGFHAEGAAVH